jgi:hypothetical protein
MLLVPGICFVGTACETRDESGSETIGRSLNCFQFHIFFKRGIDNDTNQTDMGWYYEKSETKLLRLK